MPLDVDVFVTISSDPEQRCPLAILSDDLDFKLKAIYGSEHSGKISDVRCSSHSRSFLAQSLSSHNCVLQSQFASDDDTGRR